MTFGQKDTPENNKWLLKLAVKQHNDVEKLKTRCRVLREHLTSLLEGEEITPHREDVTHIRDEFKSIIASVGKLEHISRMDERALHHEFEAFRSHLRTKDDHQSEHLVEVLEHEQAVETLILTEEKQIEKLLRRGLAYFLKYNRTPGATDHSYTSAHMIVRILAIVERKIAEVLAESQQEIDRLKSAILA